MSEVYTPKPYTPLDNITYTPEVRKKIEEEFKCSLEELDDSNLTIGGPKLILKLFEVGDKALHKDGRQSSIYIPESVKDDHKFTVMVGMVFKMNPSCYQGEKFQISGPHCRLGDWAYFGRANGTQSNFRGHPIFIIYDDLIGGTVKNPKDIRRD